jgi:DNA polymerase-1
MTTLLIDGDILLYRSSSACEYEAQWDDDVWVLSGNLEESKDVFKQSIDNLSTSLSSSRLTICLSDRANFRKLVYPEYKAARKNTRKPLVFKPLLEWVEDTYETIRYPNLEADDVIGLLATSPGFNGIVVSDDKDMKTLACTLYTKQQLTTVSANEADRFWMLQTLMGDSTDGYQGCPGIGPKTAEKLLTGKGLRENWGHVLNAYRHAGLTEEDAVRNARLARILRHGDYDFEKHEVKLWTPSTLT